MVAEASNVWETCLFEPVTILAPYFNQTHFPRDRRVLEDVKEEAFRLLCAACPYWSMRFLPVFDLGGIDVEGHEQGKLFLCGHSGHGWERMNLCAVRD